MGGLTRAEWVRKLGHIGFGLPAFAFPWLASAAPSGLGIRIDGARLAIGLGLAAAASNRFLLSSDIRDFLRRPGRARDDHGLWLYPLSIACIGLVFSGSSRVVGAAWLTVAFGDGFASLAGQRWGRAKLPWNPHKSWIGAAIFCSSATLAVGLFLELSSRDLNLGDEVDHYRLWAIAGVGTWVAAWIETLPLSWDDNVTVPFAAALAFAVLLRWS